MRKEIIYLMLIFFLGAGCRSAFLILIPLLTKDLHFSFTQAGIIGGAFAFSQIFSSIPLTALANRVGSINFLLFSLLTYTVGFVVGGYSSAFLLFTLISLMLGVVYSIFQPLIFGLTTKLTEKEHRGRVMGFVTSGSDLGRIAIAGAVSFIATKLGWRFASILGGIGIGISLIIAVINKPTIEDEHQNVDGNIFHQTKALLKNGQFLLTGVLSFFDTIASATLFVYLPFLMFYRHISLSLMPLLITLFFFGSLTGKLYLGKLTDKFPNTLVFIVAESLMAVFLIVITLMTNALLFGLGSFILGILTKGTVPASLTMAAESLEGNENFKHAYAFNFVLLSIANTITPIVVGLIADRFSIVYSFYFCAIAALVATIPAFFFHQRRSIRERIAVETVTS